MGERSLDVRSVLDDDRVDVGQELIQLGPSAAQIVAQSRDVVSLIVAAAESSRTDEVVRMG